MDERDGDFTYDDLHDESSQPEVQSQDPADRKGGEGPSQTMLVDFASVRKPEGES